MKIREINIFQIMGISIFLLCPTIGISLIFFASSITYFQCQRIDQDRGSCELIKVTSPFDWKNTQTFSLNQIKQASVINNNSRSSSFSYSLLLTTNSGNIRISMPGYTQGGVEEQANQINEFLKQPQQKDVKVKQLDDRGSIYFIGTIFTLFPFYMLLRYYYDKQQKKRREKKENYTQKYE